MIDESDLLEAGAPTRAPSGSLKSAIADLEKRMISEALRATSFNQQQTARQLGISRQGLINKIKRYKLQA